MKYQSLKDVDAGAYVIGSIVGERKIIGTRMSGLCKCGEHFACSRYLYDATGKGFQCFCNCHAEADKALALEQAKKRNDRDEDY